MNERDYKPLRLKGNGETKEFAYKWKTLDKKSLIIKLESETGVFTTLQLGKDYDVDIAEMGGNVILKTAPAETEFVNILRNTSQYQSKGYSTSPGFQGSELEKSFDKVSCNLQEMSYEIETFETGFSSEVNKKFNDFTGEINSTIDYVNKSAALIDTTMDAVKEAVATCNSKANAAENSAAAAEQQAGIATEKTEEISTKYDIAINDLGEKHTSAVSDIKNVASFMLEKLKGVPFIPFCFNSGPVNENGEPALLELSTEIEPVLSENEEGEPGQIEHKIITLKAPAVYTDGNGKTTVISENLTLDATDFEPGTHYSLRVENIDGTVHFTAVEGGQVYRQKAEPENPNPGDLWQNLSVAPELAYIRMADNTWEITKQVEAGTYTTPENSGGGGGELAPNSYNNTSDAANLNPFFFGMHTYSAITPDSACWGKGGDTIYIAKSYFNWLKSIYDGDLSKPGITVKLASDATATEYDFKINPENESFILPAKTKHMPVNSTGTAGVRGNGLTVGWTDGSKNYGSHFSNGSTYDSINPMVTAYGLPVTASGSPSGTQPTNAARLGMVLDPYKSGAVTDFTTLPATGDLYWYIGNAASKKDELDISKMAAGLMDKINKDEFEYYSNGASGYVIFPRGENGLRLCKQWGRTACVRAGTRITLLKPYNSFNYVITTAENILSQNGLSYVVSRDNEGFTLTSYNNVANDWCAIGYIN